MTFNEDFARRFAERFEAGNPDQRHKRSRPVTRRALVALAYDAIMAKRSAGYSFEGIAEYCATLGVPIGVSTLKTYVQKHAVKTRSVPSSEARQSGSRKTRPASRRNTRENAPPEPTHDFVASGTIQAAPNIAANARAESRTIAVEGSTLDGRTASETDSVRTVTANELTTAPATVDTGSLDRTPNAAAEVLAEGHAPVPDSAGDYSGISGTDFADGFEADESPADALSTRADSRDRPALAGDAYSEAAVVDGPSLSPATLSRSQVEPTMERVGSREENPSLSNESIARPDEPHTQPSRPEGLSRLLNGRASPRKNAFTPRPDKEL